LVSYRDHPEAWEAWDIDQDVTTVGEELPALIESEVVESGPVRATVRQTREFGESTIVQDISLERDGNRVNFRTDIEWRAEERLLKVHFPVDVHTNTATYDIQFGHIERETHENTSWNEAVFEEPHQQWVDVSEHGYGVSVLNDCKYGVHVDGTDVGLSLLRAPNAPDPEADRGHHQFRYAIYPHAGSLQEGGVVEAGYEVNVPATARPVDERIELAPIEVNGDGVVVESVKQAKDHDNALVVRLYESWGSETDATLGFDFPVRAASTTNLVEDRKSSLELSETGEIDLSLEPFDIQTVLVEL
jgi:alpha-mannosidase